MENKSVSVIVPVYNEGADITKTLEKLSEFGRENPRFEFIFVDDGSQDHTLSLLNGFVDGKSMRVISYGKNMGKGYAIRAGMKSASGDLILFIDGDLAYSLDHLFLLEKDLRKNDVSIGCRAIREENALSIKTSRKIFGKGFNFLSRNILNLEYLDTQAGIKGFRRDVAKRIFDVQKIDNFAFDVEVIYLAKKFGAKIGEIPARVSDEHSNKVSKVDLIKDSTRMFFSLVKVKLNDLGGKYG